MPTLNDLTHPIQDILQQHKVPGLAFALISAPDAAEIGCFGAKKHGEPTPITPETIFSAMSLSKTVSAYVAHQLVERGQLSLDVPLDDYLPEPFFPHLPEAKAITARHVLSHQTGFPNWGPRGEPLTLVNPVGSAWGYSGEGFVYLQRAVEQITGQPMDVYFREQVFEPLGMAHSHMVWQPSMADNVVWGYEHDKHWETDVEQSANFAYSMYTTIGDMTRFVQALLVDDPADHRLSRATLEAMFHPQVQVKEDNREDIFWGLGWGLQETPTGMQFWHWGASPGFRTYVVGSPAHCKAAIMMFNGAYGFQAAQQILMLLEDPVLSAPHPALAWLKPPDE